MTASTQKITVTAFLEMDFDEAYYELIDGEIVKKASPTLTHQRVSKRLFRQLDGWAEKNGAEAFYAPFDVLLNERTLVQPDLAVLKNDSATAAEQIHRAPDLTAEIISPSSVQRNRIDKFKRYEAAGVAEYWLVDPNNLFVGVCTLADGRYVLHSAAGAEGTVRSQVLAGFEVPLQTLFEV